MSTIEHKKQSEERALAANSAEATRFDYLIDRINAADFSNKPFTHIYIEDFLNSQDFDEITKAEEILIPHAESDEQLFEYLFKSGYKIINFPGCITNKNEYLAWHSHKKRSTRINSACEGFGMTLRLMAPRSKVLSELNEFLLGPSFNQAIAAKFGTNLDDCTIDCGIQKYLDGYEISPHPDVRQKALTYMVNINPRGDAEDLEHHAHLLRFRDNRKYVQAFWEGNKDIERCWVPWDWCETSKIQKANNSIIMFSPSDNTIHGIKASYDHLNGQRTQLYGNHWYKGPLSLRVREWEDIDIVRSSVLNFGSQHLTVRNLSKRFLPKKMRSALKKIVVRKTDEVTRRDY